MAFDPMYDDLLAAVKNATDAGLHEAKADVHLDQLGYGKLDMRLVGLPT